MLQQRSQSRLIRFDEQPVAAASIESLSSGLCDSLRTARSDADADRDLSSRPGSPLASLAATDADRDLSSRPGACLAGLAPV